MKKIYVSSFVYLSLGLAFGVFYREFTKFHDFEGSTQLAILHVHTLTLGMIFFLIVLLLEVQFKLSLNPKFNLWFILHNIALSGVLLTMLVRGMMEVLGTDFVGFNHIAGTFHTFLGVTFVWFFMILGQSLKRVS